MPDDLKKPPHHDGLKPHEIVDLKVETIQERNARVDAEKAWETSWTRKCFIMGVTYLVAGFYMQLIGASSSWLGAFVPVMGYLLSTFSLPFVRSWWVGRLYKKDQ